MKKWMTMIIGIILVFMLAACNQTATPVNDDSTNEQQQDGKNEADELNPNDEPAKQVDPGTEPIEDDEKDDEELDNDEKISDSTLKEVFDQTVIANGELNSFESEMKFDQKIEVAGEEMSMNTNISMKMILDPLSFEQIMDYSMDMGEGEESYTLTMYLTENGYYMHDTTQNTWYKLPAEFSELLSQLPDVQNDPSNEMRQLQQFIEDFAFEQDDDHFILRLIPSGEKFDDFLKESAKNAMMEDMEFDASLFDAITFKDVQYEIKIHKETYYLDELNIEMDFETDIEGEKLRIKQKISTQYSNHNNVEAITIPQEAVDEAEELDI